MPDDDDKTTSPAATNGSRTAKAKPAPPKARRMSLREYASDAGLDPVRERILGARTGPRDRFTRAGWDQKLSQAMKQEV